MAEDGTRKPRAVKKTPAAAKQRVIPASPSQNQQAAKAAVSRATTSEIRLPFAGEVTVPRPEHVAYYAALGTLVAIEIIEWPIAVILGAGKMLADNHHNRALREFGKALDETV